MDVSTQPDQSLRMPASGPRAALVLLALAWLVPSTAWALDRYEGIAYDRQDGELVYREVHWRYEDQDRPARLVLYRCPDGAAFARKRVWAARDAAAPNFEFRDARDGYREGVRGVGADREAYWRAGRERPMEQRTLAFGADAVVDAGFDALIGMRWNALQAGETVAAEFLVPSRLEFLDVSIGKVENPTSAGKGTTHLRMELDTWYGFAAPQTDLVYRTSDRWLLRFEGIGTIRDEHGRHQEVRIEFPPRLHASDAGRAEFDAALVMPLARSCGG